jgi:hypothetical protein
MPTPILLQVLLNLEPGPSKPPEGLRPGTYPDALEVMCPLQAICQSSGTRVSFCSYVSFSLSVQMELIPQQLP